MMLKNPKFEGRVPASILEEELFAYAAQLESQAGPPEEIYDGYAVLAEIRAGGNISGLPVSRESQIAVISEVLDALNRLIKRRRATQITGIMMHR